MTQTNGIAVKMSGVTQRRQTAGYMPSPFGSGHALLYDDNWDKRFTWYDVPKMKRDPQVLMGLRILEAPLHGVKLTAKANRPDAQAFLQKTVSRIWQRALRKILKLDEYGHMAGEVEYKAERGKLRFHQLHAVAPIDAKPLRDTRSREIVGVRITSIIGSGKGSTDLMLPNAFWCANNPEYGQPYGQSVLAGAREPWMEKSGKHGANDIRRLWFLKNAFHSGIIRYPIGTSMLPNGSVIDNQDLARQLLQNIETGNIVVLPNTRDGADQKGEYEWYYEPASINGSGLKDILEYPERLDKEILKGMCIPPEVYEAGDKGSWSGRATTMQMFFSSLDVKAAEILDSITRLILNPLMHGNYGPRVEFEVSHESLAEMAAKEPETVKQTSQEGQPAAHDPVGAARGAAQGQLPAKRMSVDEIVDDNPELYSAIRDFSRQLWPTTDGARLSTPRGLFDESEHPRDEEGKFAVKASDLKQRIVTHLKDNPKTPISHIRREMGHRDVDRDDPLANPVHAALKDLRDSGHVEAHAHEWGEPEFSHTGKEYEEPPAPIESPEPEELKIDDVESSTPDGEKISKDGRVWGNAKKVVQNADGKWGEISPVDGIFRKAGQWMPIHGLSVGLGTPAKGKGEIEDATPPDPNEEGKKKYPRQTRAPMTPEEIEEERERRDRQAKWSEMGAGIIGRLKWLGDYPNHKSMSSASTIHDKWKEFALEIGEGKLKTIVDELKPEHDKHIDELFAGRREEEKTKSPEHWLHWSRLKGDEEEYYKNEPKERAEERGTWHGSKKHLKAVPTSFLAQQYVHEAMGRAKSVEDWHAMEKRLAAIVSPDEPARLSIAPPEPTDAEIYAAEMARLEANDG